jgi:hypothetical protein
MRETTMATSLKVSLLGAVLTLAAAVARAEEPAMALVMPIDTGAELRNPGMGWMLHYYDNVPANYGSRLAPADTLDDWPGLGLVYLRIPWSYVEPREGEFAWSVLDTPMQRFASRGIPAAFRLSCSESWMRYATPQWVEAAGARGDNFTPGKGIVPDGSFWEPDYDDPVFLAKLEQFLAALAQRYDGHPDVAYIDIGSFGVWGEGHTWASTGKAYPTSTIKRHIELHLKYFRRTPLIGMDDFVSRPGTFVPMAAGVQRRAFDLVVPLAWRGRSFPLRGGLWEHGRAADAGRLKPAQDDGERTTGLGTLTIGPAGEVRVTPSAAEPSAMDAALPAAAEFALRLAGIRQRPEVQPHSLKIELEYRLRDTPSERVHPFVHLVDSATGREVFVPHEEREDEDLTRFMAERGLGLRDDSILVQPPPAAYFHAEMAQAFWPRQAVVLECEHYGGSAQRGCWQDGSAFLQAVEDYHASYASIHWWPREFLDANRDLVRRISLRLGYRLLPVAVRYPEALLIGEAFTLSWQWRNGGVAPPYRDAFPAITLKDARGGLVAVLVDHSLNLRSLSVALAGPAPVSTSERSFTLPFQMGAGEYDVLVSVGDALGKPEIALPLAAGDGHRRYAIGRCRVTGAFGARLVSAQVDGDRALLQIAWQVHTPLPDSAIAFVHLEQAGKLLYAGGPLADEPWVAALRQPGEHVARLEVSLAKANQAGDYDLLVGLWCPERIGRDDERLVCDSGRGDRRVLLGRIQQVAGQAPVIEAQ